LYVGYIHVAAGSQFKAIEQQVIFIASYQDNIRAGFYSFKRSNIVSRGKNGDAACSREAVIFAKSFGFVNGDTFVQVGFLLLFSTLFFQFQV
jgi:hypothetical protein